MEMLRHISLYKYTAEHRKVLLMESHPSNKNLAATEKNIVDESKLDSIVERAKNKNRKTKRRANGCIDRGRKSSSFTQLMLED